jgi:hypothetical protein
MIFRLRLPAALARVALKRAGTSRRLSEMLVEALQDDEIFDELLARADPTAPRDEDREPTDEEIDLAAQRQEEILRGPWRNS